MVDEERHESTDRAEIPHPYEIVSIRSVGTPPGLFGNDWFRYVIRQGHNQIVGFRAGDKANVTLTIEDAVHRLNHRRQLRRGRTHVVLAPKSTNRS